MRFPFPCFPAEFEIPDEWWQESGMVGFRPSSQAYRSTSEAIIVPLREIEPPFRYPEHRLDGNGFGREAITSVLRSIAADEEIKPARLLILPPLLDISRPPFKYRVLEGLHKFYASVAAGFDCLPVVARECCA